MDTTSETALQRELARMQAAIDQYASQLDELDGALVLIEEENNQDDVARQIKEYEQATAARPEEIAAEDAMDNIVRLQNQLKIVKRRNQLLSKENGIQTKQLRDRAKELEKVSKSLDQVVEKTAWRDGVDDVDDDAIAARLDSIHEMSVIEQQVRKELKSSTVIIKKKEEAIAKMQVQLEEGKEATTKLDQLLNDVRVKQRDCREAEAKLQRMRAEDSNVDMALVKLEQSGTMQANSVSCMEADREFLSEAVAEMKATCRRQDNIVKAQIARQEQLQARLDTVMESLRDMRLEREFDRNVAKSALVPSSSREEPTDVSEVLPQNEKIPIDTYRLLYKNNEMILTCVALKNLLVLEKESVVHALEAKMQGCVSVHNTSVAHEEGVRLRNNTEMNGMINDVERQQALYRAELESLQEENNRLKNQLRHKGARTSKASTTRAPPKKTSVRRAPVKSK